VRTFHKIYKELFSSEIMSLKTKKLMRIVGVIAIGAAGLAAILSGPTIAEQVEEKKFEEDRNTALYNYSKEQYLSGQSGNISELKFSSEEALFDFVKAYSQDYSPKK
jgi:hypothetical protein